MTFIYILSRLFITSWVYLEPTYWPAPSWLVSSVDRALHEYRRGQEFKSRTGLIFFSGLIFTTEDHLHIQNYSKYFSRGYRLHGSRQLSSHRNPELSVNLSWATPRAITVTDKKTFGQLNSLVSQLTITTILIFSK